MSIFNKIVLIICALLVPILILYTYSYQVSTNVVENAIHDSNINRLSFFNSQVDSIADQMGMVAFTLMKDRDVLELELDSNLQNSYDNLLTKQLIGDKISIQSNAIVWGNQISLFFPGIRQHISTDTNRKYDLTHLQSSNVEKWSYEKKVTDQGSGDYFVRYLIDPYRPDNNIDHANLVIEVAFSAGNIVDMLNTLKEGSDGEPFFYHPNYSPIINNTANTASVSAIVKMLNEMDLNQSGQETIKLNGLNYIVNYTKSQTLGWYIIDFLPMETVLLPMTYSRNLFNLAIISLLVLSIIAAAILYRNVQVPIRELIIGIHLIKNGDYSGRVKKKTDNEFQYLFVEFNRMAEKIQQLIERVYKGDIALREATLKQLQSQINPHFLYNSFAFIQSMAQLNNHRAIITATQHLSKYYRYTTYIDRQDASLIEEITFVENYLMIHKLQMHRLEYSINIPEEMQYLEVPKLIVQPIVENAVIHGIEPQIGVGIIQIFAEQSDQFNKVIIEDNGGGLDQAALEQVKFRLTGLSEAHNSCGLWNVQQRLLYRYGHESGLQIEPSSLGGLKVTINMKKNE